MRPRRLGCAAVVLTPALAIQVGAGQPARAPSNHTLTAVPGIRVGHHTLVERPTGCTAILADGGAVGGVSQRGGAPATRETDLLDPLNLVDRVNAISLSGGSAFGLDAASGVVRWLEEKGLGWETRAARVPIVPAASFYDLHVGGKPSVRPAADCGYKAAQAATSAPVTEGNVGAGAGATIGQIGDRPMKSGIGSAAIALASGLVVGALVAVNSAGDIIDPATGRVLAGMRDTNGRLVDARKVLRAGARFRDQTGDTRPRPGENTTIGVVATNARLTKAQATRMALMADDGYARAISPVHTLNDGDTVFALATGRWDGQADVSVVGALAAEAMADAIVRAATQATGLPGVPAARDLRP